MANRYSRNTLASGTDGTLDDLGVLITAGMFLDRDWMSRGKCRQWVYKDDPEKLIHRPSPWHVANKGVEVAGEMVSGQELVKVALLICFSCPVQWDCARYAVEGQMKGGTWSMRITALRDLQNAGPEVAFALIDRARAEGVPMQVAVRGVDSKT